MSVVKVFLAVIISAFCALFAAGQSPAAPSLEVSEADGVPVILKHLPDWENVRSRAKFMNDLNTLEQVLGKRPVFEAIDFSGGTEAAFAEYDAGKLLIVEYTNPQASIDADNRIRQVAAPETLYRRIGNYNVLVFDVQNQAAANSLLDQVKYEKDVQWLGEDPFLYSRLERYFVTTTRDIFISTIIWILMGLGLSIGMGILAGILFFRFREQKRAQMTRFSDAGGLTRLNLDDLSEPIIQR